MSQKDLFKIGDEVVCWIEQGSSIHLKAVTRHGDPVELTEKQARKLAHLLHRLVDDMDS